MKKTLVLSVMTMAMITSAQASFQELEKNMRIQCEKADVGSEKGECTTLGITGWIGLTLRTGREKESRKDFETTCQKGDKYGCEAVELLDKNALLEEYPQASYVLNVCVDDDNAEFCRFMGYSASMDVSSLMKKASKITIKKEKENIAKIMMKIIEKEILFFRKACLLGDKESCANVEEIRRQMKL